MIPVSIDTSSNGDRRKLRLSLCVLLSVVLLAGCASTPEPAPQPLTDHTPDSAYRLGAVDTKLRQAESVEYDGNRVAAVAIVGTAQRMLPVEHEREHDYLQVIKAGMWAREGDGHDSAKAAALLDDVSTRARLRSDWRLLADVELVNVVLAKTRDDTAGVVHAGNAALQYLQSAKAYLKLVEVAGDLAYQLLEHDTPAAVGFATRARDTAVRLEHDEAILRAELVMAQVELETGGDAEVHFLEAYEAAYRMDDLAWRNVVISRAISEWYLREDNEAVRRWGNRLRSQEMGGLGGLPSLEEAGLWAGDYITMLAQYAFAVDEIEPGSARVREAAALAVETIEALPDGEAAAWQELAEKLRSGLLQAPAEK